jgi:predicted lipoprotein with Yx(FWY)xxD motif
LPVRLNPTAHAMGRALPTLSVLALAVGLLAGCGSSSSSTSTTPTSTSTTTSTTSTPAAGTVQVSAKTVSGLGPVLVNAEGRTLYIFEPDKKTKVTCVGSCASLWPPLKLSSGKKAVAVGEAKSASLGSVPNPEGGQVVTYAGWPLYTYAADSGPGTANGQALNANGGLWYVISPSGTVITKAP